ncbi:hypothetical protein, partial [Frankia sp. CiP3]|uniref:hypothetical protein n=1 Tax=Frankia sp. CiP3 TaxID=2880971 RepID=UPI001EF58226
ATFAQPWGHTRWPTDHEALTKVRELHAECSLRAAVALGARTAGSFIHAPPPPYQVTGSSRTP